LANPTATIVRRQRCWRPRVWKRPGQLTVAHLRRIRL